eukprot:12453458-Alexandrium_andersonii.AAC.1
MEERSTVVDPELHIVTAHQTLVVERPVNDIQTAVCPQLGLNLIEVETSIEVRSPNADLRTPDSGILNATVVCQA